MNLSNRAGKGFNVIQAVILSELKGLTEPNPYGHFPLRNKDPLQPIEDYFEHVDYIVNKAEDFGLYMGLLPSWGNYVTAETNDKDIIFNPENAYEYGKFLGKSYKDKPVIWVLGGDRTPNGVMNKWNSMAKGLKEGSEGKQPITYSVYRNILEKFIY